MELLPHELCAVVGDDGVRDPEVINDVSEECYGFFRADLYYGSGCDSFEEFADIHEQVREAPGRLSQRPHHV
jgi:hypothetical protein